jgi:Helix-turn-helix domain
MHAPTNPVDRDNLLTELQAAKVLNLSTRTLQAWRNKGSGPSFVRAGRAIRYRPCDLLVWIQSNTVCLTGGNNKAQ